MTRNTIREDLQNEQCQEDPGCDAVLRFVEVNSKIFSICLSWPCDVVQLCFEDV